MTLSVLMAQACCVNAQQQDEKIIFGSDLLAQEQIEASRKLADTAKVVNNNVNGDTLDLHLSYYFGEMGEAMPFRVCLPASWDGKSQLPLAMFLHGAWNTESSYLDQDDTLMVKLANKHNIILVSPLGGHGAYGTNLRLPAGFGKDAENDKMLAVQITPERAQEQRLSEKDVINVIEIVLKNYPVDRSNMFLMGHSMGSGGTWYIGAKYNAYWKAIAPMSGPFVTEKGYPWNVLKDKPIYITEGTQAVSLEASRTLNGWLKNQGYDVSYKEVEADHPGMVPLVLPDVFDFFDKVMGK